MLRFIMKYDFDRVINRSGTNCVKWDKQFLKEHFPNNEEQGLILLRNAMQIVPGSETSLIVQKFALFVDLVKSGNYGYCESLFNLCNLRDFRRGTFSELKTAILDAGVPLETRMNIMEDYLEILLLKQMLKYDKQRDFSKWWLT